MTDKEVSRGGGLETRRKQWRLKVAFSGDGDESARGGFFGGTYDF